MRTLGGALGGQIAATLLAANLGGRGLPTSHGYGLAFGMCAAALVASVVVGLLVPRRARRPAATQVGEELMSAERIAVATSRPNIAAERESAGGMAQP